MISVLGKKKPEDGGVMGYGRDNNLSIISKAIGTRLALNYTITIHMYEDEMVNMYNDGELHYGDIFGFVEQSIGLAKNRPGALLTNPQDMRAQDIKEIIALAKVHAIHTKVPMTYFADTTDHSTDTPTLHMRVGETRILKGVDNYVVEVINDTGRRIPRGSYQINLNKHYIGSTNKIIGELKFALFCRTPPEESTLASAKLNMKLLLDKYSTELSKGTGKIFRQTTKRKSTDTSTTTSPKRTFLSSMANMLLP